jgi:hypothetical protein
MSSIDDATIKDDDWLDSALREAGREHRLDYVSDDGFTARVMDRLPEHAALPAWRRPVVTLLWLLVGAAALLALPGWFEQVFRGSAALFFGHRLGLVDIAMALTLMAIATWTALIYVARSE